MGRVPRIRSVAARQAVGTWSTEEGKWWVFARDCDGVRPSQICVFTDEHLAGVNDGGFGFRMPDSFKATSQQGWVDFPAGFHGSSGAFSFIDGHAEVHRWVQSPRAGKQALSAKVSDYSRLDDGRVANHQDVGWLAQHTSHPDHGVDPWER